MTADLARFEGVVSGSPEALWNQSYYFNFYDPDTRYGALIRVGLLENRNEANSWLIVFHDGLPVFTRTNLSLPYVAERPAEGMTIAGMHLKVIEPLERIALSFSEGDFAIDLQWDAMHPLADCISMTHNAGELAKEVAQVHLEGPCHVTGQVTVRGEKTAVNGTGFRDVAAGVRNWDFMAHYRLSWPIFENKMAFAGVHAITTTGASAHMQMYNDGEQWLGVSSFEDRNEYNADNPFTWKSMEWSFVDDNDRKFTYTGTPLFTWAFAQDSFVVVEQMMEYRLSDGTVGYGIAECGFRLPWTGVPG